MFSLRTIGLELALLAVFSGDIASAQTLQTASPNVLNVQIDQSLDAKVQSTGTIPTQPETGPSVTEPPASTPATSAQPADTTATPAVPLTPAEQKAADNKAALDAILAEATVLKTSYDNSRRSRNKTPVSLSAFRSMELRLKMAAAADPANTQASDMANAMRMAQYEILKPSVQIAAVANRELYAHEMGKQLQDDGMKVTASGRGNSTVRFVSPQMTRQMAMQLVETAKIPEQARALQFRRVVFSSGRRSWTYDVARGRLR